MKKYISPESTVMVVEVCRCLNISTDQISRGLKITQEETFSMEAKERNDSGPTNYNVGGGSADEEYDALW